MTAQRPPVRESLDLANGWTVTAAEDYIVRPDLNTWRQYIIRDRNGEYVAAYGWIKDAAGCGRPAWMCPGARPGHWWTEDELLAAVMDQHWDKA